MSQSDSSMTLNFRINDHDVSIKTHPLTRLLDVIREKVGLTGTKEGCGEGECGACAVLLNGQLVDSCLVPALQVQGSEVTTIEGIAASISHQKIIETFVQSGGIQCGMCTPGMVMGIVALMAHTETPSTLSDEEIRIALGGNLCRCTGYMKIIESVKR